MFQPVAMPILTGSDLQAGSAESIIASQYVLKLPDHDGWSGALQIAPDGKIYLTIYAKSFLGVINKSESKRSRLQLCIRRICIERCSAN